MKLSSSEIVYFLWKLLQITFLFDRKFNARVYQNRFQLGEPTGRGREGKGTRVTQHSPRSSIVGARVLRTFRSRALHALDRQPPATPEIEPPLENVCLRHCTKQHRIDKQPQIFFLREYCFVTLGKSAPPNTNLPLHHW
jgi:hypothetical protein